MRFQQAVWIPSSVQEERGVIEQDQAMQHNTLLCAMNRILQALSKHNLSRELYSHFILIMPHFHLEKENLYSIQHRELYSELCGDLNGKEIQKRGDTCIHTAD